MCHFFNLVLQLFQYSHRCTKAKSKDNGLRFHTIISEVLFSNRQLFILVMIQILLKKCLKNDG